MSLWNSFAVADSNWKCCLVENVLPCSDVKDKRNLADDVDSCA